MHPLRSQLSIVTIAAAAALVPCGLGSFAEAGPGLPAPCDTWQEQAGPRCQAVCKCDCSSLPVAGPTGACGRICGLPQGVHSIPWCRGGCAGDNDAAIRELGAAMGYTQVSGCGDLGRAGWCEQPGSLGDRLRELCCATCGNDHDDCDNCGNGSYLSLPPPDSADPVQLFLLAGQSECVGSASPGLLNADAESYPGIAGTQEGVWLAARVRRGKQNPEFGLDSNDFFIAPMRAGDSGYGFGPEVGFGQRVRNVTGARVMVVKYCWGGSSIAEHWNPDSSRNSWNYDQDDGTSGWLERNARVDYTSKYSLFVNLAHTARLAAEQLTAAGVEHRWAGFAWVQGAGDSNTPDHTWEKYGADEARLFDMTRAHAVGVWDLPIVDTGGSGRSSLIAGKLWAHQTVSGCNAVLAGPFAHGVADPESDCVPGAGNACPDSTFVNVPSFQHYGWDPQTPAEMLEKYDANEKRFRWFKAYPEDMHSEDQGMVLKGQMLANAYIRSFTEFLLPAAFDEQDPAIRFPLPTCAPGAGPAAGALCWVDGRDSAQAAKQCAPQPPPARKRRQLQIRGRALDSGDP